MKKNLVSALERKTTVEAFAEALHITLQQMMPVDKVPAEEKIMQAVLSEPVNKNMFTPLQGFATKALQSMLGQVGVQVAATPRLHVPSEDRKYVISSPKLNPKVHLDAQKKLQERLEKEYAFEKKRAHDPALQQAMRPMLTMTPPGV